MYHIILLFFSPLLSALSLSHARATRVLRCAWRACRKRASDLVGVCVCVCVCACVCVSSSSSPAKSAWSYTLRHTHAHIIDIKEKEEKKTRVPSPTKHIKKHKPARPPRRGEGW